MLVDEYQDTNHPQYEIVREIGEAHRNLCVVGDDDQSIYGWRGADIRKILNFGRDFPGAAVVRLETNYRSTNQILKVANAVIRNNAGRHEKTLHSALGDGPAVRIVELEDEDHEADFVVHDLLARGPGRAGRSRRTAAILFRTQVQPGPSRRALGGPASPTSSSAAKSFFDRKEVRDVLAYLELVATERRAVPAADRQQPPRGVGDATVDKVLAFATRGDPRAERPSIERWGSPASRRGGPGPSVRSRRRTPGVAGPGLPESGCG